MTFDTRGGSSTISRIEGAAAAKMAPHRCSGILYGVRLNRSRRAQPRAPRESRAGAVCSVVWPFRKSSSAGRRRSDWEAIAGRVGDVANAVTEKVCVEASRMTERRSLESAGRAM